ncbi:Anaphase-promoting complex (APC), subunit 10 [Phaffia rhodozyma]|uniref:Anaphase-promoting complex subunit 10 n=1 Tax=Phaffia rhodozyma TaxID=264483 RepID=A0A0F7SUU9_PHARH|nr:Anaphase-promoting complex (APC), subunit 10 [Phaffia rhodozyma]
MSWTVGHPKNARDISKLATWSVSSHKFGFGVDNLKDPDPNVFWQSEGPQPHHINLQFPHFVPILKVSLHLSHPKDDSYTPQKVCIRAGTGFHDLTDIRIVEFQKPDGWMTLDLRDAVLEDAEGNETDPGEPIEAFLIQVVILGNHLNGKDTHVRGVKVWGPEQTTVMPELDDFPFTSIEFRSQSCIR